MEGLVCSIQETRRHRESRIERRDAGIRAQGGVESEIQASNDLFHLLLYITSWPALDRVINAGPNEDHLSGRLRQNVERGSTVPQNELSETLSFLLSGCVGHRIGRGVGRTGHSSCPWKGMEMRRRC